MGQSFGRLLSGLAQRGFWHLKARAADPAPRLPDRLRPAGPLVWMHAPGLSSARALAELIRRIRVDRDGLAFVLTYPPGLAIAEANLPFGVLAEQVPADTATAARAFLDHWQPDVALFAEGTLPRLLVDQAHRREVPVFLVDGRADPSVGGRVMGQIWGRIGLNRFGPSRFLLEKFDRILVQDAASARRFRRLGAPAWRLEVAGKMEESAGAMPCTEAERDAMAGFLRSRPVWLAVSVPEIEETILINALRQALRLSHRLLLILVPEDPARGPALAELIARDLSMNVSVRSRDEDPDQEDQVYIADTEGEFGLWYRLAPVTYMGGTLLGGVRSRHPYESAALGSAILHGPLVGTRNEAYGRLREAGAARMVRNALELEEAVSDLMAPDRAAQMAHSAWMVTTSGAEVTDRVVRLVTEALDARERARVQGGQAVPVDARTRETAA